MANYYFDTEFIEDGSTIDLISLGMVDDRGCGLHLFNWQCDLSRANQWVQEHVIPGLPERPAELPFPERNTFEVVERNGERVLQGWGTRVAIREALLAFVGGDEPQFWAYYGAYDWVALCQLFGDMSSLPKHFPMFHLDLRQVMHHLFVERKDLPDNPAEHDAYADACWNREAHCYMSDGKHRLIRGGLI
jgi:hypothetical protein